MIANTSPGIIYSIRVARRHYRCERHDEYESCGIGIKCQECDGWILPGQRYVRMSLPPFNNNVGNKSWWVLRRHAGEIETNPCFGKEN